MVVVTLASEAVAEEAVTAKIHTHSDNPYTITQEYMDTGAGVRARTHTQTHAHTHTHTHTHTHIRARERVWTACGYLPCRHMF